MPGLEEQVKFVCMYLINPIALLSLLFIHKLNLNAAIAHAKEKETLKRRKAIIKLVKKFKVKAGTNALREIRRYQKSMKNLLPRAPF